MRRKLSRIVAGFLTTAMIFSGNIQGIVFASDGEGIGVENEQMQQEENILDTEKVVEENHGLQKENTENIEGEVSNQEEVLENQEEADLSEQTDEVSVETEEEPQETLDINYFYLEKLSVYEDEALNVVLSLGEGTEQIDNVSLTYADEAGNQYQWKSADNSSELFLFKKTFEEEASGIFQFITVNFRTNGEEKSISFQDKNMSISFGVNCEYDGSSSTESLEMESLNTEAEVTATVTTIDEDGVANDTAELEVAEALTELGGAAQTRRSLLRSARSNGNIVVVLDPGHDASHSGARANGVQEEVATLKIAQYCKEELEKYSGITVYMTRTTAACPFPSTIGKSGGNIIDIKERVKWAASKGADAFVSFHLDSAGASAHGAHVYYPGTWFASNDIVNQGASLANAIQKELIGVGLYNRGTESADYAVNTESASYGFPGLIIEHAFLTNVSDANTYLKTKAGLKRLGVADANGIVKYFNLTPGYWEIDEAGNKFYYDNSEKVYGEKKINGSWYYFEPDKNGAMVTGWHNFANRLVYYKETGEMAIGELKIEGKWYLFDSGNGAMVTGWHNFTNRRVYYKETGEMAIGELKIEGKWYLFNNGNGAMVTGWHDLKNRRVYYKEMGEMALGELKIEGKWYLFNNGNGAMVTGWHDLKNRRVYYKEAGEMAIGELKIEGKWYLFNNVNGAMVSGWYDLKNRRVYYKETGEMAVGELKIEGKWYLFGSGNGAMVTGWRETADRRVYYTSAGERGGGELKIDGFWYYLDPALDGAMKVGWYTIGNRRVYYNIEGKMVTGEYKIDGKWYLFNTSNGAMVTGWYNTGARTIYYMPTGAMALREMKIEDKYYYFRPENGAMITDSWVEGEYYGNDGCRVDNFENVLYRIEGNSSVTVEQLICFYEHYSPIEYPKEILGRGGAATLKEFCQLYFEEARAEEIKPEVAFAQAMVETGWLEFDGDVDIAQYNFAGLGATGNGEKGNSFDNVRIGIRAQIQHLKAYASDRPLNQLLVDNRFRFVKRNCAPYVLWLGQQENPSGNGWAVSANYGKSIMRLIAKILNE